MFSLLLIFKAISIIFALASVATGLQAILYPLHFAKSFGIPLTSPRAPASESYISLLGVRQFATALIILTFGYQGKGNEVATILVIIGVVVAGTDGLFIARAGSWGGGAFHAIPGAAISVLAFCVLSQDM
jgi:hypothetical protein